MTYQYGPLFDPRELHPPVALLADAVQLAYERSKEDRKEAIAVWDEHGNEIFLFLNGQRWKLA